MSLQEVIDRARGNAPATVQNNAAGIPFIRIQFDSPEALEAFFVELIGAPGMKGIATKAIGSVLLAWGRA